MYKRGIAAASLCRKCCTIARMLNSKLRAYFPASFGSVVLLTRGAYRLLYLCQRVVFIFLYILSLIGLHSQVCKHSIGLFLPFWKRKIACLIAIAWTDWLIPSSFAEFITTLYLDKIFISIRTFFCVHCHLSTYERRWLESLILLRLGCYICSVGHRVLHTAVGFACYRSAAYGLKLASSCFVGNRVLWRIVLVWILCFWTIVHLCYLETFYLFGIRL